MLHPNLIRCLITPAPRIPRVSRRKPPPVSLALETGRESYLKLGVSSPLLQRSPAISGGLHELKLISGQFFIVTGSVPEET
jgi:hypothetical protein